MHTRSEQGTERSMEPHPVLVRARWQQITAAAALDMLAALILLALVAVLARAGHLTPLGTAAVLTGALLAGALCWAALHRRYGAGPGALLLRLRTIDPASAMPAALPRSGMHTYDISAGIDPLRLDPDPVPLPSASETFAVDTPAYITIEIDDGRRLAVRSRAIVGHRPGVRAESVGATPVVLTDFSRTVDRTHALVSLVPQGILIEALTYRASTWIEQNDTREALAPGASAHVSGPVDLLLGERRLRLARRDAKAGTW